MGVSTVAVAESGSSRSRSNASSAGDWSAGRRRGQWCHRRVPRTGPRASSPRAPALTALEQPSAVMQSDRAEVRREG